MITAGTPISIEDVLIGAICDSCAEGIALRHGFAVVTSNVKHFKKIESLEVVNWKS